MIMDTSVAYTMSEAELIAWLTKQDDLYENEGDSDVDDATYDSIKRMAEVTYPANKYFTGVGAGVRGGKVQLAYAMLGLTQLHLGELDPWVAQSPDLDYVVTHKLDGTSAQVIYDEYGKFQIAYSRGNGSEGADISRHILKISSIPKQISLVGATTAVRMEIIIKKSKFAAFQQESSSRSGRMYKNARNAVAGLMNSSESSEAAMSYVDGVAYTIMGSTLSKSGQLLKLSTVGFIVAQSSSFSKSQLNEDALAGVLSTIRKTYDYEVDGVVVDVDRIDTYQKAVKYKVADESNTAIAVVSNIDWSASKDGYLKPTIHINPVELVGVTISKCTGFNAKYILDNKIQPGCSIQLTRSGDVIPHCLGVTNPGPQVDQYLSWFNAELLKQGEWGWSENSVDAILTNVNGRKDVMVQLIDDVFSKLGVEFLGEGNISKMYDAGFTNPVDILNADMMDFHMAFGATGRKSYDSMHEKVSPVYWPTFVGAMGVFGRGISRKKLTKLYDAFEGDIVLMRDIHAIVNVEGFDVKTATRIVNSIDAALDMLGQVSNVVTISTYVRPSESTGTKMEGQGVCFTGVRDINVEAWIVQEGGTIKSGVSGNTTILVCKDPSSNSGKIKKAYQLNIEVITLKDMVQRMYI